MRPFLLIFVLLNSFLFTNQNFLKVLNEDKGVFGIEGTCNTNIFEDSIKTSLPSDFLKGLDYITRSLGSKFNLANFCIGDFNSDMFTSRKALDESGCSSFPLVNGTYSVFAFNIPVLPCPTPTKINLCLIFDKEHTYGLTFNLGLPMCVGEAISSILGTSAIAITTKTLTDSSSISLGYSQKGNYLKNFTLAVPRNNDIETISFGMRGHFYFNAGFFLDKLSFVVKDIKLANIIQLQGHFNAILQVEDESKVSELHSSLASSSELSAVDVLLRSGINLCLNTTGFVILKLSAISFGKLPDISLNIDAPLILSKGNDQLSNGAYFHLGNRTQNAKEIVENVSSFYNNYYKVFDFLGLSKLRIEFGGVELAGFINDDYIGLYINILENKIKCLFKKATNILSCKFNLDFVTFIEKNAMYIAYKVDNFFSVVGPKIFEENLNKFKDTIDEANRKIKKVAEDAFNGVKSLGNNIKEKYNDVCDFFKGKFNNVFDFCKN